MTSYSWFSRGSEVSTSMLWARFTLGVRNRRGLRLTELDGVRPPATPGLRFLSRPRKSKFLMLNATAPQSTI